jgi:hypothetical protein
MMIEVGKTYYTRDNLVVTIREVRAGPYYPFLGTIDGIERSWTADGVHTRGEDNEFDLVAEVPSYPTGVVPRPGPAGRFPTPPAPAPLPGVLVTEVRRSLDDATPEEWHAANAGYAASIGAATQATEAAGVRAFGTGATRSADAGRYDPEGFLSPIALERYALYMAKQQVLADGSVRESDNWQRGIPGAVYMKGLWRHMLHLWTRERGYPVQDPKAAADAEEDLCALLFGVQGLLHEKVKARLAAENRA